MVPWGCYSSATAAVHGTSLVRGLKITIVPKGPDSRERNLDETPQQEELQDKSVI